jgi:iron only hydrogenase large subunit-like protein
VLAHPSQKIRIDGVILDPKKPLKHSFLKHTPTDARKIAIEIMGCRFHGCLLGCGSTEVNEEISSKNLRLTKLRLGKLTELGFFVVPIQTCQIMELISKDEEVANFFRQNKYQAPMRIREGFFGAQVSMFNPYCKIDYAEETIEAFDVGSCLFLLFMG